MINAPTTTAGESAGFGRSMNSQDPPVAQRQGSSVVLPQPIVTWRARFTDTPSPSDQVFGRPFGEKRRQHIVRTQSVTQSQIQASDLTSNQVLVAVLGSSEAELTVVQQILTWLETVSPDAEQLPAQWVSLPGTQVVWHPQCLIVSTSPERSDRVCQAALEVLCFAEELRSLEAAVDAAWESTLEDAPLGFEFSTVDIARRSTLAQRFQTVCQLRTRYARLIGQVVVPHVYPPTLASQMSERLRERCRLEERLELIDERIAAQESIYERCSQRCSDFMVARTGHHLEWIIIILLAFQTILWIVDVLSSNSGVPPTTP